MSRPSISVVFSGSGGAGAMTAGELLLRAAAEAGYYGSMHRLLGPQVRGGEAAALVQLSTAPTSWQPDCYDLFVALDWEKTDQFAPEITLDGGSLIIRDPRMGRVPESIEKSGAGFVAVEMGTVAATPLERSLAGKHANIFAVLSQVWQDCHRASCMKR